jgi:zinc D-Ala-D-Ala carboxypeptidase
MNLSRNFTLQELTKSDTAVRLGVDNNPNANQIEKLKLLCENILQPVRDHFGPVTITSGFRSPALCVKIGSSINSHNIHRVVLLISNVPVKIMRKWLIGFIKT